LISWRRHRGHYRGGHGSRQFFGGNGYMTEYRVEQLARDAKSLMIYAGSNEIQVTHIAKGLLAQ
jgi:alkylation response protein AidB-like acyl-CoA dehydrogenase